MEIEGLTKLYLLLYSAFAEASFLKLIHTPHTFSQDQIDTIQKQKNLEEKWRKCFELAFQNINQLANLGEIANKKQTLERILIEYIIKPSEIRNKIAHGQWSICLNNNCTAVNNSTTALIKRIDFVKIDIYFEVYSKFLQCIEDLMESPRTHYRDYYVIIEDLLTFVDKTKEWTLESKRKKLKESSK